MIQHFTDQYNLRAKIRQIYSCIYFFFYTVDFFKHIQKSKRQYAELSCTDYLYSRVNSML